MKKNFKFLVSVAVIATALSAAFLFVNCQDVSAGTLTNDNYPTEIELATLYVELNLSDNQEPVYDTNPRSSYPYSTGKVSDETLNYALNVVNYIRYIARLDSVELNDEYTDLAQHGVVLLNALGKVTHTVEYSEKPSDMQDTFFYQAQKAVRFSNLSRGQTTFSDSISVQMHDGDSFDNLLNLGHRRNLLNPTMQYIGLGAYDKYYSIYCLDGSNSSANYDFIAWPAAGNQPTEFHVAQEPWSITLNPNYYDISSLNDAVITVTKAETNESVTLTSENYSSRPSITTGYFSADTTNYGVGNCIAFHPGTENIGTDNIGSYLVSVSGLMTKSGEDTSLVYETNLFSVMSTLLTIEYPKKDGYTFDGWYYDEKLTIPYDESNPDTADVDTDSLYIKWVANEYYVWYYANGGSGANGGLIYELATYDQPYTLIDRCFYHKNSRLAGWSTTPDGEVEYELGETIDSWNRNSSLVLYAVWELDDYTLSFDTEGGSEIDSVEYQAESLVDLSQYVPTKQNYDFTGWYLDAELTTPVSSFTIKSDTIVYAGWIASANTAPSLDKTSKTAYVNGYGGDLIYPETNITRAEVAQIFYGLLTEESREYYETNKNRFSDVSSTDWYNAAISTLANANILDGYANGTFLPDDEISRAELVKIAASFEDVTDITVSEYLFTDISDHWAVDYIVCAANEGWINGYTDGTFNPEQSISRAETVKILNSVTNRTVDDYSVSDFTNIWSDNQDTSKWYYWEMQVATNTHTNYLSW